MRVAILTWFHYHNYGTALQVTALAKTVEALGHSVDIVNYKPNGKITAMVENDYLLKYAKKAVGLAEKLLCPSKRAAEKVYTTFQREALFDEFYKENLNFTKECKIYSDFKELNNDYDAFICGSDQIWAPSCFDPRYFLDFVSDNRKMIAYAPSVGLPSIENKDIKRQIKNLVSRFENISTREKSGSKLLSDLTKKEIETVLDPTLLKTAENWQELFEGTEKTEKYLLVYLLRENGEYLKKAYEIAKEKGLSVKIIPVFEGDLNKEGAIKEPVGPKEFLSLLKNADFVCTDSFHGTVFSINFEIPFLTFERFGGKEKNNQNSRIYNILKLTKLEDRLYKEGKDLEEILKSVDFKEAEEELSKERECSLKFLKKSLKNAEKAMGEKTVLSESVEDGLCCGCFSCEKACPTKAIEIKNINGFKIAAVDHDKCIKCGKCVRACPLRGEALSVPIKESTLYSYKDNDEEILKTSTSGGFAQRLARLYSEKGYTVIGCAFDKKTQTARHIVVPPSESEKLDQLRGSKYMQSDFSAAMAEIKNGEEPVIVFGTPCQISAAKKNMPKGREAIYIDLICHGVPSYTVYEKYLDFLEDKKGIDKKNAYVTFRYKGFGWRKIYLHATDGETEYCAHQDRDPYFRIFESTYAYSRACYDCRWRNTSSADIRIGDYWGTKFEKDTMGVSMAIANTDSGEEIIEELKPFAKIEKQEIADYFSWQQTKNDPPPVFYDRLFEDLNDKDEKIEEIADKYLSVMEKKRKFDKTALKILKPIKKLLKK